ncbi:hypothetical protein COU14_03370, partial [Candidatus Kaiserbacteria bacterium CG10_big_fil_rev_8_21_14_0_10_44_10]
ASFAPIIVDTNHASKEKWLRVTCVGNNHTNNLRHYSVQKAENSFVENLVRPFGEIVSTLEKSTLIGKVAELPTENYY